MTWTIKGAPHQCKLPGKEETEAAGLKPKDGDIWTCDDCGRRYELRLLLNVRRYQQDEWLWRFKLIEDGEDGQAEGDPRVG